MMGRMLRGWERRVGDADVEDLATLLAFRAELDRAIEGAVLTSRARHGRSWADIARAMGTSRQRAQFKYGPRPAEVA
jgi:hypothetical protein